MIKPLYTLRTQRVLVGLLLSTILLTGCSGGALLKKKDYQQSLQSHYRESPKKALEQLPNGENNTFIKTMEIAYLNLLQGKAAISDLEKYSELLDQRVRYRVSREVKSFFYGELPEGYYASEHEIILLHMFLSWGYSLQGKYEKARVEARKSSHLLEAPWSEEGHFDDAMLRIWLGGLWAMCGSWEDARVDFKVAWQLNKSLKWAKELSESDTPPKQLVIILGGVGPTPVWDSDFSINPLRGLRHIDFKYMGRQSKVGIHDNLGNGLNLFLSPDSRYWYQRHLERDNAIHELIEDSHYGQKMVTVAGQETTKVATSVTWGTTVGAISVLAGYGIAVYGGSGDAVLAGIGIAYTGVNYSINMIKRTLDDSAQGTELELNPSDDYRFARFLPEYIWVGWSNEKLFSPLRIWVGKGGVEQNLDVTTSISRPDSQVYLAHYADVDVDSVGYEKWLTHEEKWQRWHDNFEKVLSAPYHGKTNWDYWLEVSGNIILGSGLRSVEDHPKDYSRNNKVTVTEKSIVIEFRKGLFQKNPILTVDLGTRSLIADKSTQELLVSSYAPSELLNEIDERIYALENNNKEFFAKKLCTHKNSYSHIFTAEYRECMMENSKERPRRAIPLNVLP